MVKVHPTANKVHVLVDTYLPPRSTPDMLATFRLPVEVEGPMTALKDAFLSMMPKVPMDEYDRFPTFPMFNMSIKVMVWNVQGVGNKLAGIREVVRINDPTVLVLVETHISGEQAQRICDRIGYTGQTRAEAQGRGYLVFLEDGAVDP